MYFNWRESYTLWNDSFEHVLLSILGHRCVWITNFKCWQKAYVELRKFEHVELRKFEYVDLRKIAYVELRKFRDIEVRNEHITEFCMYQMQDMEGRPAYCMSV